MTISEQTYERVAIEDGDETWELVYGQLRRKPPMTFEHNAVPRVLKDVLREQLPRTEFVIAENSARLRISTRMFYVPDLCVIPLGLARRLQHERGRRLEVYEESLPLVVEVWSPSTGEYDVEQKPREYQLRGDAEIWRIHPYERTLTAWRRQPGGSYTETVYREGRVPLMSIPGVGIDLDELFE